MKRIWVLVATLPFLFSCAKMLSVGHENFKCEATEGAGVCGTMESVYENRDKLLRSSYIPDGKGDYAVIKGEGGKLVLIGKTELRKKKVCKYKKIRKRRKKVCKYKYERFVRIKKFKDKLDTAYEDKPIPVMEVPLVQRIWIYPYVDKSGNFVEGHFIYTIVRQGKWLDHRGREVD